MTDKKCKYDGSNQHVKNWNEYDDKSESPPFKLGQEYIMANRPNLDDEKERERWKNMYHISDFFNIPDGPRKNPNLTCDYETATKDISDGLSSNQSKISVSTWKRRALRYSCYGITFLIIASIIISIFVYQRREP